LFIFLDYILVYLEEEGKIADPKHVKFRERLLSNLKKSKIETEKVVTLFMSLKISDQKLLQMY